MWDLSTIQIMNIAATELARNNQPERQCNCGEERKYINRQLARIAISHFNYDVEKALQHYSKDAK